MRRFFSLLSISIYTGAVFGAGMLVGQLQLYALYVLVYTGAVFMVGVYIGEKLEQNFSSQAAVTSMSSSESDGIRVRESDELTLKQG